MTNSFHEQSYWQQRYDAEDPDHIFDWYIEYEGAVQGLVHRFVPTDARILMIGAGNSLMSEKMYAEGYRSMVNIDFVPTVVERMRARCGHLEGMTFEEMDARELSFDDRSFDAVIDKGTLDAADMGPTNLPRICSEASRVLRPGGVFVVVSITPPTMRALFLDRPEYGWSYQEIYLPGGTTKTFGYVMQRT